MVCILNYVALRNGLFAGVSSLDMTKYCLKTRSGFALNLFKLIELLKASLMKLLLLHLLEMAMVGFAIPASIKSPTKAIYKSVYAVGPSPESGQKPPKKETNKSDNSSKVANTKQKLKIKQVYSGSKGKKYVYEIETESIEDETKDTIKSSKVEKEDDGIFHGEEIADAKGQENKTTDNRTQDSIHALKDYAIVVDEEGDIEGDKTMKTKTKDSNKKKWEETRKSHDYQVVPSVDSNSKTWEESTKTDDKPPFTPVLSNTTTESPLRLNIAI